MKKIIAGILIAFMLLLLVIQLFPLGKQHDNPPVVQEPGWDSPQTRQLAQRACFDCHSNETIWPWYSYVAPISWLIARDVREGRERLNFSEWGQGEQEVEEVGEVVRQGSMPPNYFLITHPAARLSPAEKEALIKGFSATFGVSGFERGEDGEGGEEDGEGGN